MKRINLILTILILIMIILIGIKISKQEVIENTQLESGLSKENLEYERYLNKEILLSNYVANPTGKIWDFGNWMIEYQEYCTFVNEGNHSRTVNFYLVNGSSVFYIMKDLENHILKSGATVNVCTGEIPIYSCTIPPKTTKTLVMQFVLPANTGGSVKHYIHLK